MAAAAPHHPALPLPLLLLLALLCTTALAARGVVLGAELSSKPASPAGTAKKPVVKPPPAVTGTGATKPLPGAGPTKPTVPGAGATKPTVPGGGATKPTVPGAGATKPGPGSSSGGAIPAIPGFGIPGMGGFGGIPGMSGGWGGGYGGPGGGYARGGVVAPSVVCADKGPCYRKRVTCPRKCFSSYSGAGKGYGGGGGGGSCTVDCKVKCTASC